MDSIDFLDLFLNVLCCVTAIYTVAMELQVLACV